MRLHRLLGEDPSPSRYGGPPSLRLSVDERGSTGTSPVVWCLAPLREGRQMLAAAAPPNRTLRQRLAGFPTTESPATPLRRPPPGLPRRSQCFRTTEPVPSPEEAPAGLAPAEPMLLHYEPVPSPENAPAGLAPAEPMLLHYEPVPSPEEAPAGLAPAEPMFLHYRVTLLRGSRRGAGLVGGSAEALLPPGQARRGAGSAVWATSAEAVLPRAVRGQVHSGRPGGASHILRSLERTWPLAQRPSELTAYATSSPPRKRPVPLSLPLSLRATIFR